MNLVFRLLILIVIPLFSLGRDTLNTKSIISNSEQIKRKTKKILTENSLCKVIDTVILQTGDTAELIIPTKENVTTKIVIAKEKSTIDYFKYLLPIFTLILGIILNKCLDFFSERKRIKRAGKRWVAELRSLETPLQKQIEKIEEFLENHNKEKFEPPKLTIVSTLNCEIFKSLDKSDFLRYIEIIRKTDYNNVVKTSNKTHGYIAVLVHLHETVKNKFHDYLKETTLHTTSLSAGLQALNKSFRNYGVELEKELSHDPSNDPRYKPIYGLFLKYIMPKIDAGNYDIFELEKYFLTPLIEQYLSELRLDDRTIPLTDAATQCLISIKRIKLEKKYLSESLTSINTSYKSQFDELKKVLTEIEENKK